MATSTITYIRHQNFRLKAHSKSNGIFLKDASFTPIKVGTFDPNAAIVNPCDVDNGGCGAGITCINKSGVAKCFDETCDARDSDNQIMNMDYKGTISQTKDGTECKKWSTMNHNYCRGVGNYKPWCWKITSGWDYCGCPEIPNPCDTGNGGCQSGELCYNNAGTAECKTIYSPQVGDIIRLKSVNIADNYIRHKDWISRISKYEDSEPFLSDSQWKVIDGLSGTPDTVSLQSVNEGISFLTQSLSSSSMVDLVTQEDIDQDANNKAKATWTFEAALDTLTAGAISIK